jgi:hypothetical protein
MVRCLFALIVYLAFVQVRSVPPWFAKSFSEKKLNDHYSIIKSVKPLFLEADFNGDKINDIAVQVINNKSRKKGVLIMNGGSNKFYVFGAGIRFSGEDFDNTNWLNGWRIDKSKFAYKNTITADGDIIGGKRIRLHYPAMCIYAMEDGDEIAGQLIYWDGSKYISIHQGE